MFDEYPGFKNGQFYPSVALTVSIFDFGLIHSDATYDVLYTKDGVLDIIPDFNTIVLIDHMKYNYDHEVTENMVDDVRISSFNPFTKQQFEQIFID